MGSDITPLVEQFRTLREEIHLRVRQHTQLTIFKILSLGTATSFLVDRFFLRRQDIQLSGLGDASQYYVWLIPIMASIFDTLIAGNLRAMYNIGPYIKQFLEPRFREFSSIDTKFWEEAVASASKKYYCYSTTDLVLVWIFTVAPLATVISLRSIVGFTAVDIFGMLIGIVSSLIAIISLMRSIHMKREYQ
jgi:hypothetical protein